MSLMGNTIGCTSWERNRPYLHRVQLRNPFLVTAAFERRLEPNSNNFQCEIFRNHPLADRKDIRIVVLARKAGSFLVPAKRATDKMNLVRGHRFAVARSAKNDAALAFAPCNHFCGGPNEKGIVYRVFVESAAVLHFVAERGQEFFDLLLVTKAGVIRSE